MDNQFNRPPTHEQITRRAYQIYLEHGFQPGNELTDWLEAEKELTVESNLRDSTHSTDVEPSLSEHATA